MRKDMYFWFFYLKCRCTCSQTCMVWCDRSDFMNFYKSSLLCSGTFASLGLLCCMSFAHPVVDDCAPVRNWNTVNTWGHVVGDSPDLSIKLISSRPIIDKASQTSLMLYLCLTESNVLIHVVESVSISIAVSERFVYSFNRLLLNCWVWHHLVHLLIAELHLFGSDICSVVGSWVFNMWL